jgi:hypothetical protein
VLPLALGLALVVAAGWALLVAHRNDRDDFGADLRAFAAFRAALARSEIGPPRR